MTTHLQAFVTAAFVVFNVPAWAAHGDNHYDYAKVVDAQPITEIVQIPQDQQVCREVPVQRRVAEYRSPAPAIFGAIVGGIVGNQLSRGHGHHKHGRRHGHGHGGHGNNRAAATVAGAAIGGVIASEVQYRSYPAKYYSTVTRVCNTETSWRSEEQVVGWDVSWRYRGQIYHSRMDQPPGDRIRVRVDVNPVYE